jgi:hypothetical protein
MPALPAEVYQTARQLGVDVFKIGGETIRFWNDDRGPGEYRYFCGWYWTLKSHLTGNAELRKGPYPCESAAFRDAREYLQEAAATSPKVARVIRKNLEVYNARAA